MITLVSTPSVRLTRRVLDDFGSDAVAVLEVLEGVPETLQLADKQDPERIQAALVLPARGDLTMFAKLLRLAQRDWRDALVAADLAQGGWAKRLEAELGPPT